MYRLLVLCLLPSLLTAAPALTARLDGGDVVVEIGGKLFTRYHTSRKLKKPYLWPLAGPRSGQSVTTESSEPYPHHNSLWFGCDHLNGRDYWHHQIANGAILSQQAQVETAEGAEVVFTDVCDWCPRDGDTFAPPVLRDYRRIVVRTPSPTIRTIDFTIVLVPLVKVTITKTNHSLFALRMAPELAPTAGGSMVDTEGRRGEKQTFGQPAPWMDCANARDGVTEGAAIIQHPGNRWYPSPWFTRDYGFLSPTPMQWLPRPLVLGEGEPTVLSYRVVVHTGTAEEAGIAKQAEVFAADRPVLPRPFMLAAIARLPEVRAYRFGDSRKALATVERAVSLISGTEDAGQLAKALAKTLGDADCTPDAQCFLCRQLGLLGGKEAVTALAEQLGSREEHVAEAAALALGEEGSVAAQRALATSLPRLSGRLQQTVVGCMGGADREAVATLVPLLAHPETTALAAESLALIATDSALLGLHGTWQQADGKEKAKLADPLLRCLASVPPSGTARDICRELQNVELPVHLRRVLLGASLNNLPADEAQTAFRKALADPQIRAAALVRVASVTDERLAAEAASRFPELSTADRVMLFHALATRRDPAYAGTARAALADPNPSVVAAACFALGAIGGEADVPPLLDRVQQDGGGPALTTLARIHAPGVTAAIGSALNEAGNKAKSELVDLLVRRMEKSGADWLVGPARSSSRGLRKQALEGLAVLGSASHRDTVLAWLSEDLGSANARKPCEQCAATLLRRFPEPDGPSARCLELLADAPVPGRASLLRVLGLLGEPQGLPALVEASRGDESSLREAAIRALAAWPTPDALAPLLDVATRTEALTENVLALRGCRRLLATMADADSAQLEKLYADCRQAARRDEERKLFAYAPGGVAVDGLACTAKGTYRVRRAGLRKGALWATDREYTFTEVPPDLLGCTYIETVMNHRSLSADPSFLTFRAPQPVDVFVGFDNRCRQLPAWLKDWERTPMVLRTTTDSCHLVVYRKSFPAGNVAIGGAKATGVAAMYTVVLRAAQ